MPEEMENVEEVSVEKALQMEKIQSNFMDVLIAKKLFAEQEVLDRVGEAKKAEPFLALPFVTFFKEPIKLNSICFSWQILKHLLTT
jgi:hypothetical protein